MTKKTKTPTQGTLIDTVEGPMDAKTYFKVLEQGVTFRSEKDRASRAEGLRDLMNNIQGGDDSLKKRRKKELNQMRGGESKTSGDLFEDYIEKEARRMWPAMTLLRIPAKYEHWRPSGHLRKSIEARYPKKAKRTRIFLSIPDKSVWVDFIAMWPGGIAHFDAKFSRDAKNAWSFGPSVSGHQMEKMMKTHKLGHPSFFFLRREIPETMRTEDYIIPVTEEGLPFKNKSSITYAKIAQYKMPRGRTWRDAVDNWSQYLKTQWSSL